MIVVVVPLPEVLIELAAINLSLAKEKKPFESILISTDVHNYDDRNIGENEPL